ncbi:hypothetical protein AUP68_08895 [Ilyonectria robusta]
MMSGSRQENGTATEMQSSLDPSSPPSPPSVDYDRVNASIIIWPFWTKPSSSLSLATTTSNNERREGQHQHFHLTLLDKTLIAIFASNHDLKQKSEYAAAPSILEVLGRDVMSRDFNRAELRGASPRIMSSVSLLDLRISRYILEHN